MMNWTDATSYRQGAPRVPTSWAIQSGRIRVSVVGAHLSDPESWVMHCHTLGIDTLRLGAKSELDEVGAKAKAIRIAQDKARELFALAMEFPA